MSDQQSRAAVLVRDIESVAVRAWATFRLSPPHEGIMPTLAARNAVGGEVVDDHCPRHKRSASAVSMAKNILR
jgi:hypothetical protein